MFDIDIEDGDFVALVDIGTWSISAILARISFVNNGYTIILFERKSIPTSVTVDSIYECLVLVLDQLEKKSGIHLGKVVLSLNNKHANTLILDTSDQFDIPIKINRSNIHNLIKNAIINYSLQKKDEVILDINCQYFTIDGQMNVLCPIGIATSQIKARIAITTTKRSMLSLQHEKLSKCRLNIVKYISSLDAISMSCISDKNMNQNVLIINIGASEVSVALCNSKNISYVDTISTAGQAITAEIAKIFSISIDDAERIKTMIGSLNSNDNTVLDHTTASSMKISRIDVLNIIKSKLKDIFSQIKTRFESKTKQKITITNEIIITGGGANIIDIDLFARSVFNINCTIGMPEIDGSWDLQNLERTNYATTIGMIKCILRRKKQSSMYSTHRGIWGLIYKMACFLERLFH